MKRHLFFKTVLLLCALVAGSSYVWADDYYVKVTSLSELTVGDSYILADVSGTTAKVMGALTTGSTKRGTILSLTASGNIITVGSTDEPYVFELGKVSSEYTLKISGSSNYLAYKSGTGLQLLTATTDDKAKWTITLDNTYGIEVTNKSATDRVMLRNGTSAISAYAASNIGNTGYAVSNLYKKVAPKITAAEYATYCTPAALDFSTTGIKVYTAKDNGTSVTLNEITSGKVPANTPVILYKSGATGAAISVPVIASASAVGDNDLAVSTGTDVSNMYVLADGSAGVGFYPWAGTTDLSAGKVYLQATSAARSFIGFEEGTTSINVVKYQKADGQYYNLAGQRVAQPTKGLYIVNGKKVIIK